MSTLPVSSHNPVSQSVALPDGVVLRLLEGAAPPARIIEAAVQPFHLHLAGAAGGISLSGDSVAVTLGRQMLEHMSGLLHGGNRIDEVEVRRIAGTTVEAALKHDLAYRLQGLRLPVRPMSLCQVAFLDAMLFSHHSLIFGLGPTGTGKTHLAIVAGLALVAEEKFKSLVITRPHVLMEGEVMTPSLRAETIYDEQFAPIEDELRELISPEEIRRLTDLGKIEIAPLGRMRGRTFNESFIIVDEAQNLTVKKMRMAVTRLGRGSRMVITGDMAQSDLPQGETSGLPHLLKLISGTDLALVHQFSLNQIIRNDLVARLEALYARDGGGGMRAAA